MYLKICMQETKGDFWGNTQFLSNIHLPNLSSLPIMEDFMNIPTDVQRQMLLRATYISHDELKDVCRSWKEMMCSPRFYEDRKTYGTSQHLISLIQDIPSLFVYGITVYDPVEKTSERTPPIPYTPPPFITYWRFFSVNGKLVLFGESFNEIENFISI